MRIQSRDLLTLLMALLLCLPVAHAAGQEQYRARLSPVPASLGNYQEVRGEGEVISRLEGNTLHISLSFKGMSSAPVSAHLHRGRRGIAGPPTHALALQSPASEDAPTAGQVSASLRLDDSEVEALRSESFYVQVHSENNPEGELRGWLLPSTTDSKNQ